MKKLFSAFLLLVSLQAVYSQTLTADELLKASECNNHRCFKNFIKSKEKDFVFDTARNFLLDTIYQYKSVKGYSFLSDEKKSLTGKTVLTFGESSFLGVWGREITYLTNSKDDYTRLIGEFEKKGFKQNKTEKPSATETVDSYAIDNEVNLKVRKERATGLNTYWTKFTFLLSRSDYVASQNP